MEALTDFIKNAGGLTLLHFLVTGILLLVAIIMFIAARSHTAMPWFTIISFVPVLSGILSMYLKNRLLETEMGKFGRLSSEAIAEDREAIICAATAIGATGTTLMVLLRVLRTRLNRR